MGNSRKTGEGSAETLIHVGGPTSQLVRNNKRDHLIYEGEKWGGGKGGYKIQLKNFVLCRRTIKIVFFPVRVQRKIFFPILEFFFERIVCRIFVFTPLYAA